VRDLPHRPDPPPPPAQPAAEAAGVLEGGDEEEAPSSGAQMRRELPQESERETASIGSPVQGDLVGVGRYPPSRDRGEVRRVREDPVEAPEPAREVAAHEMDGDRARSRALPGRPKRAGVQVHRDDPRPALGGPDGEESGARADVEHPLAGPGRGGERLEQEAVLAGRIGLRRRGGGRGRASE
jgi:hypothetical protein